MEQHFPICGTLSPPLWNTCQNHFLITPPIFHWTKYGTKAPTTWNIGCPAMEQQLPQHGTLYVILCDNSSHKEHFMSYYGKWKLIYLFFKLNYRIIWLKLLLPVLCVLNFHTMQPGATIVGVGEHIIRVVGHFLNRGGSQLWCVPRCATATYA